MAAWLAASLPSLVSGSTPTRHVAGVGAVAPPAAELRADAESAGAAGAGLSVIPSMPFVGDACAAPTAGPAERASADAFQRVASTAAAAAMASSPAPITYRLAT